jgi:hypothetical protein
MNPEPFDKKLFDRATELGIKKVSLNFEGGNDEGYLYVSVLRGKSREDMLPESWEQYMKHCLQFENDVENWAWENYSYSGAGEGHPYGDNIIYNIEEKTVSAEEWYTQKTYDEGAEMKMELYEDYDLEDEDYDLEEGK